MPVRLFCSSWSDDHRPLEIIAEAAAEAAEYVVVGSSEPATAALIQRSLDHSKRDDLVVVFDSARPARRPSLRTLISPVVSLIAGRPNDDVAVALSVTRAHACGDAADPPTSIAELVLRMAEQFEVTFAEFGSSSRDICGRVPRLTMPPIGSNADWLPQFIEQVQVPGKRSDSTEVSALKAGLFLLNDFFHESHSCSQSIEGLGRHRAGDYWHAILHRREPDFGNAKYWFRHVGRHPIFVELARRSTEQFSIATDSLAKTLQRWQPRLVTNHGWDPFAFVDLCEAAQSDAALREWCEVVQYEEILLLLGSTWNDAVA